MVDFHDTPSAGFRGWMARNHVNLSGHLLEALDSGFESLEQAIYPAYGGLWRCCVFIDRRKP